MCRKSDKDCTNVLSLALGVQESAAFIRSTCSISYQFGRIKVHVLIYSSRTFMNGRSASKIHCFEQLATENVDVDAVGVLGSGAVVVSLLSKIVDFAIKMSA